MANNEADADHSERSGRRGRCSPPRRPRHPAQALASVPRCPPREDTSSSPGRGGRQPGTPGHALRFLLLHGRTFFDSVAVFGDDGEVHGMLAESIEPNADYTEWTIKIRDGVMFTDGSPVNAAAVIYNLQATGTGPDQRHAQGSRQGSPSRRPDRMILKIEQLDELTFVIYTGDDGDPQRPLPWRNFPHTLTGQWGLIAPPFWLAEVGGSPEFATQPAGSDRSSSTATSHAARWRSVATRITG